jgi:hypothetical protein
MRTKYLLIVMVTLTAGISRAFAYVREELKQSLKKTPVGETFR